MMPSDTIAALATPSGRGGIGIVRVSGPLSSYIAEKILGKIPKARYAEYLPFRDGAGNTIDVGLALYFHKPNSFTGEDVLELHGHGGPVILDLLLKSVIELGARPARPGEFSQRAYLNDKLDLTQAEAIADLIDAGSEQAARAALRSLQGEFSNAIHRLVDDLTQLRIFVEASIDFTDEEIDFLHQGQVEQRISQLKASLVKIKNKAQQGSILKEGVHIVLAGQPNAGKSSLLNALAGREAAIVTPIAGTTRDVVKEEINLDGLPLHIIDTAGLRESEDIVEQEGIRRTWNAIQQADAVLLLIDDLKGWQADDDDILKQFPERLPVIVIHNKIDMSSNSPGVLESEGQIHLYLSAKSGEGISLLIDRLKLLVGFMPVSGGTFMARRRHIDALRLCEEVVEKAAAHARSGRGELIAEELRIAQQHLGEITGEVSSDDLLGKIFASFCIGK